MRWSVRSIRLVIVVAIVLSFLGGITSPALAGKESQDVQTSSESKVTNDLCSYPINIDITYHYTEKAFYDNSGTLTRLFYKTVELDTFSANGKSIAALPYAYTYDLRLDSSGNVTHGYITGEFVKVLLPGKILFYAFGWGDVMNKPTATFFLPDHGVIRNQKAFCAYLAP
jgi:hypothetical protein